VYVFCVLRRDLLASSRTSGVDFSFAAVAAESFFCLAEGPCRISRRNRKSLLPVCLPGTSYLGLAQLCLCTVLAAAASYYMPAA
jgi:hypothetical protein